MSVTRRRFYIRNKQFRTHWYIRQVAFTLDTDGRHDDFHRFTRISCSATLHTFTVLSQNALTFTLTPPYRMEDRYIGPVRYAYTATGTVTAIFTAMPNPESGVHAVDAVSSPLAFRFGLAIRPV